MKQGSGYLMKIRRGSLVLFLCYFLSVTSLPTPASAAVVAIFDPWRFFAVTAKWAARFAYWALTITETTAILTLLTDMAVEIPEYLAKVADAVQAATDARIEAYMALMEVEIDLAQATVDAGLEDSYLEKALELREKTLPSSSQRLCKSVHAHTMSVPLEIFAEGMSTIAQTAIDSMYQTPGDVDGNSPAAVREAELTRCEMGYGRIEDGYDSSCVSDLKGADGRPITDLDLTGNFNGMQAYEVAKFTATTEGGQARVYADPQNTAQKFWTAGLYHCRELGGFRPTPPGVDQLATPVGMTKRAQWNHCVAAQSAFTRACTNALAFVTRPNDQFSDLNENLSVGYESVLAANVELDPSYEVNSNSGMSLKQSIEAALLICKSDQFFVDASEDGATRTEMRGSADKCAAAWNAYDAMRAKLQTGLVLAAAGSYRLPDCWKGTGQ